ncbi:MULTISPECIES: LacI family DNA-binding transcriptional regulator [unclassified Streptomyces]|uniref:LacI family DNA-binding transcriptional regulator n=1 Tax=unclassified Streptomyces TaxID=2593676 RepID=UPI002F91877A
MRGARQTTRNDVARIAGVSTAVVSYVLNDGPRPVSESARRRVLAAVEKTGYRVNDVARALKSGRTRAFGLAAPSLLNPFIAEIARSISLAAAERGALVLLGDTGEDQNREDQVLTSFLQRQVDGIVYMSTNERLSADIATGCDIPIVVFQLADDNPFLASVRIDEAAASRAVGEHLLSHGYRQFVAVVGPESMRNSSLRLEGFGQALDAAGIANEQWHHLYAGTTRQAGWAAGHRLLVEYPGTEAVFAGNESLAIGVIAAAHALGRRVPEDLAVIAFNGSEESRFHVPALSISRQPVQDMATKAIDILNASTYQPDDHYFAASLIPRRSCGCDGGPPLDDGAGPDFSYSP